MMNGPQNFIRMPKHWIKTQIALLIILIASSCSYYWFTHKPKANRSPRPPKAPLVEVITPVFIDHFQTVVTAMGTVIPSQSVNLTPRISGMVIGIGKNFIEGGILRKGETLVQLDPTDYQLAIKQSENDLAKAQYNLKLEQGQQAIVRREFQLLGSELSDQEQELVLRKPHLQSAKAALSAAEASLKLARLNLERTKPISPFNAIVTSRNANLGAWMSAFSTGTPLAKLVGTDSFWINASIAVDKLKWIDIPQFQNKSGSAVKISHESAWGKETWRSGQVKRLQAELEPEGRMAKVIVEVDDPLCLKPENQNTPPLMLGSYVRLEILGNQLNQVLELPETALHDDHQLWLMTNQETLAIQTVDPIWYQDGKIYLNSQQLAHDAQIIVSNLATPIAGMRLRHNTGSLEHNI